MKIAYKKSVPLQAMLMEKYMAEFHDAYHKKFISSYGEFCGTTLKKYFAEFLRSKGYKATVSKNDVIIEIPDKDYCFYMLKYG